MAKMKWTATKLKVLAQMRKLALERWNKLDEKLRRVCTHPKSTRYTTRHTYRDTLGCTGDSEYQDRCSLCEAYLETYSAEGGTYNNPPHYELRDKHG